MKCTFCSREAIYKVRDRRIYLCNYHFRQYIETEVESTVSRFEMLKNVKKVLTCVSGGKDSVVMLKILHKICSDRDIKILGLVIDVCIGDYSKRQVEYAVKNFKELGVDYVVVKLEDFGICLENPDRIERLLKRPICSICGIVKRYIMNKVALEEKCDVVATGHNLIDISQYALMNILTGNLEYLVKLKPKVEGSEKIVTRIRPLYFIDEKEIELYAETSNLEYLKDQCPYSTRHNYRKMTIQDMLRMYIREIEDRNPGFFRKFLENLNSRIIPILEKHVYEKYSTCKICGMPSKGDICTFCKIITTLRRYG